jgi:hypothetical protein
MPCTFYAEEYADIHFAYELCNGNARAAADEYWRLFALRIIPYRQVSVTSYTQTHSVRETGTWECHTLQ